MTERALRPAYFRAAEATAVVLNLLYTWLYIRQVPISFLAGALGSAILVYLCIIKKLYAESGLQLFYVAMAIRGLMASEGPWQIRHTTLSDHLPWIICGVCVALLLGFCLDRYTDQKLPYVDAFTATFALIATWHMVNFVHENWYYWIAINSVSMFMYARRGMWIATVMFAVYLVLSVYGLYAIGL
ncbi:MAG: nicotinamide mononucleotide transporter [Flavobacteriales bacterium]|nr:nicotinamide mononucleotide transporter [Flavobacteriales bacterium]